MLRRSTRHSDMMNVASLLRPSGAESTNNDEVESERKYTSQEMHFLGSSDNNAALLGRVDEIHSTLCDGDDIETMHVKTEGSTEQTSPTNEPTDPHKSIVNHSNGYSPGLGEKCSICPMTFKSELSLRSHYKSKHSNKSNGIMLCVTCNYKTKDVRSFAIHGRLHTGETPYMCAQCGLRYTSQNALGKHVRFVHEGEKSYKCSQCRQSFKDDESFKLHRLTHTNEHLLECEECSKSFACRKGLSRHLRYVHNQRFSHICSECGEDYVNIATLNRHMMRHQREDLNVPQLNVHKEASHTRDCIVSAEQTIPESQSKEQQTHMFIMECQNVFNSDLGRKCCICRGIFNSEATLYDHYKSKHRDKSNGIMSCISCSYKTKDVRSFSIHGCRHTGEKPHVCSKCGERFISRNTLIKHEKLVHQGEKGYNRKCLQCGECFQQVEAFKLHRRSHKKEPPHECELCEMTFTSSRSLTTHIENIHTSIAYICEECGVDCRDNSSLQLHMISHRESECIFSCVICEEKYPDNKLLKEHILGHSGREILMHHLGHMLLHDGDEDSQNTDIVEYSTFHNDSQTKAEDCSLLILEPIQIKEESLTVDYNTANLHLSYTSEKCCVCRETFTSEAVLRDHYKSKHYNKVKKRFLCTLCSYNTIDASKFITHGRVHTRDKPYACILCDKRYTRQTELREHASSVHHLGDSFNRKCQQCGERFKQKEAFRLHQLTHKNDRPYMCNQCDKRFLYSKSLTIHIRFAHDKSFAHICGQCGVSCISNWKLKRHILRHHCVEPCFECTVCGEKYPNSTLLKEHSVSHSEKDVFEQNFKNTLIHHLNHDADGINGTSSNTSSLIKTEDKSQSISEHIPTKEQTQTVDADVHLATAQHIPPATPTTEPQIQIFTVEPWVVDNSSYTSEKCCICHETFKSEAVLRNHYKSKHYDKVHKRFSCILCTFKTIDTSKFVTHGRVHSGEKPYACIKCGKRYTRQRELRVHVRLMHHGGESYNRKCPLCGERFQQSEAFKLHQQTHKNERPYVCDQCHKTFLYFKSLTIHIRYSHDKVFTHICSKCGVSCISNSKLKLHMFRHHGGESSSVCTVCGKKCSSNSVLKQHELSHSGDMGYNHYDCPQCNKRFFHISKRNRHIKTVHSGERPFKCVECGKTFKHRNHLNTHLASHSTECTFQCIVCGKMFASNALLKIHAHSHTRKHRVRNTERNFACLQCDKKFYDACSRIRHMKTVHDGERPFVCVLCGKSFKQNAHLKTHMTSHSTQRQCT